MVIEITLYRGDLMLSPEQKKSFSIERYSISAGREVRQE